MFIDKVKMLAALCEGDLKLESFDKCRLTKLEKLRNALAHPRDPWQLISLLSPDSIPDATTWMIRVIAEINATIRATKAS